MTKKKELLDFENEPVSIAEGTDKNTTCAETPDSEPSTEDKMKLYNSWAEPPKEVTRNFNTGTFKGTDIRPQWRIQCLTEAFGPVGQGWYTEITKQWTEDYEEQVKAFVNINLYVKYPGCTEWSAPIEGSGGNTMVYSNGRVSDEGYKMAETDAISRACQKLGIGANIYMGHEVTKYTQHEIPQNEKTYTTKKTVKPAAKSKTSDVDTIFSNSRDLNIELIRNNLKTSNPNCNEFRKNMVEFIRDKGKKTYQNLSDAEIKEFLINELGRGKK